MILSTIQTHAAAFVIGAAVASGATWKVQGWMHDSKELEAVEQVQEDAQDRRVVADTAATKHEVQKVRIDTEFITITEKVENVIEKVVYRDRVCLDDDGLRVLNEAVRAADNPGKPQDPVR